MAQSRDKLQGLGEAGKVPEGSWEAEGLKEWISQTVGRTAQTEEQHCGEAETRGCQGMRNEEMEASGKRIVYLRCSSGVQKQPGCSRVISYCSDLGFYSGARENHLGFRA